MPRYFLKIFVFLSIALVVTGCLETVRKSDKELILARVGGAILKESDVKGIYSPAISGEDSVKLLEGYVNTWVKKQLKIQEAERLLVSSGVDVETLVNDYRNLLLTNRLDQYYVEQQMDTVIPPAVVEDYYNQHRAEFPLDRALVKGRIVRVPASYRQQAKLKELMGSPRADRQQDFMDTCAKNNFVLTEFEQWTEFREFLNYLPTTRGQNYDRMTTNRKVQEMSDADYKYYIQITENLNKGDQAPLERVEHLIRRIIHNQRSTEIIRRSEDSLYNAALGGGKVEINISPR